MMDENWQELFSIYCEIREKVHERLDFFESIRKNGSEEEIFEELVFCLMTPQTNARQAERAMMILKREMLVYLGSPEKLSEKLKIVRFRNNKARYICEARSLFLQEGKPSIRPILDSFSTSFELRDWLSENIIGFGYKEASHFLRNTGYDTSLAILDRHVIRNLISLGILGNDVKSITRKSYLEIEKGMKEFSRQIGIPMDYLDFVFIFKDTGDIFK